MPAILYYKKNSEISHSDISEFSLRFLADSNRRTRFCRPLTKPLIQGTIFLVCGCKGSTNFEITNYPQQFFFVLFFFTPHSLRFFSSISFSSQPLTQLSQGFLFSRVRRKKRKIPYIIRAIQSTTSTPTTHSCQLIIQIILQSDKRQRIQAKPIP